MTFPFSHPLLTCVRMECGEEGRLRIRPSRPVLGLEGLRCASALQGLFCKAKLATDFDGTTRTPMVPIFDDFVLEPLIPARVFVAVPLQSVDTCQWALKSNCIWGPPAIALPFMPRFPQSRTFAQCLTQVSDWEKVGPLVHELLASVASFGIRVLDLDRR